MILQAPHGAVGYDESGAGVPLLWLHGYPLDRTLWAPQLAHTIPGVKQIAIDLPGFGESDRLTAARFNSITGGPVPGVAVCSLDAWADSVAVTLTAMGIPRVILGGLSMGGYLAFAFWRRHAVRVRALILADTRAGADSAETKAKRTAAQALVRAEGSAAIAKAQLPGMFGKTTRATHPELDAPIDAMMRRQHPASIADALEALRDRPDSTPTLETITVPTLVVCGEEDVLTPMSESELMQRSIPGSRLARIPGAGHLSNFEAPAVFNRLLSEFLTATIRDNPT